MRKSEQMSFFLCVAGELQFSLAAAILSSVIEVRCAGSQQEKKKSSANNPACALSLW